MKTLLTLTLLTLLPSLPLHAEVNMKDASYYKTWIDLEVSTNKGAFQLRRTYHSRSLHPGIFGFGWCSDFEKTLDLSRSDQIQLKDCRLPTPLVFKKKKENLYESPTQETLEFKNHRYLRTTSKNVLQIFDQTGKLIRLQSPAADSLELRYDNAGFLQRLLVNNQAELHLEPDALRRHVQSVTTSKGIKVAYHYEGRNLMQVKNAWNNSYNYAYDDFQNLVRIQYPDQSQEVVRYNVEKDWVVQITHRDHCLDTFQFLKLSQSPTYLSVAEKRCQGKLITQTSYEFRHKARADGSTYLDQVKITQGNKIQRVSLKNLEGPLNESQ